jgi:3-hydroxyisobutyrate dehydrogenase-like beta-hydroxyacid dehydrogenase
VLEAINTAGASSRLLNGAVATMRRGDYTGSGTLRLHRKDLDYALDLAREVKAFVPLTGLVRDAFQAAELKGEPNWSQPGIAVVWEDLSGCSLADD